MGKGFQKLLDSSVDALTFSLATNSEELGHLDPDELLEFIQNIKSKKTPGLDKVNAELLKNVTITFLLKLFCLLDMCYRRQDQFQQTGISQLLYPFLKKVITSNVKITEVLS